MQTDGIIACADRLVKRFCTRDPFDIAEGLGVRVLTVDYYRELKGMYAVVLHNRFIFLSDRLTPKMRRIVCAHELGHDRLHRELAKSAAMQEFMLYQMDSRPEYEANLFAASLLLPDDEFLEHVENGLDAHQIASAMNTDPNLVALKADCLIRAGHPLYAQDHDSRFLRG